MPTPTMNQIKQKVNQFYNLSSFDQGEYEDLDYCELYHTMLELEKEAKEGYKDLNLPW